MFNSSLKMGSTGSPAVEDLAEVVAGEGLSLVVQPATRGGGE